MSDLSALFAALRGLRGTALFRIAQRPQLRPGLVPMVRKSLTVATAHGRVMVRVLVVNVCEAASKATMVSPTRWEACAAALDVGADRADDQRPKPSWPVPDP